MVDQEVLVNTITQLTDESRPESKRTNCWSLTVQS